ncbi:MAG TPA: 3-hydroxyacyl-CoA dehydrogenase NAD-binding domain-containing protein [Solirubrobacteraceae bacterium]|nr:3-hydroxyacyl-CoA dehydrogenase NAD-binding domain-containing protein [Solirubrobacteraceae bacterium]
MPADPPPPVRAAQVIGVVGAGTMGAGIAQLACLSGARTLVHDPDAGALTRGLERIERQLARGAERGRWDEATATASAQRLERAETLGALADCDLVIEAAPERLEVKRQLLGALAEIVAADCVLATNTSSLLVTAMASAAGDASRVVGMHFFNPPPVMRLLEVVRGVESADWAVQRARATGEAMGKHVIDAVDGPGFIVNRCNRPFGLEALRLLAEQVATVPEIDRAVRMGGGFRMGPFEVMDLVGVDVGLDVSRSFFAQSFGEPRWQPSPIAVRTVAAGRLGRKTGRGYYEYPEDEPHRPEDPEPPPPGGGDGIVVIAGDTVLAHELREAAGQAGWAVADPVEAEGLSSPFLILDLTGDAEPDAPLQGAPQAICLSAGSLAALDPGGSAVGFHALPPLAGSRLVELSRGPDSSESAAQRAERFFTTLGKHTQWVADAPGLVLGRMICQVVNEAAFALGEGYGSAQDIDAGMKHGLNYPRGILAWADEIGLDHVLGVLDALYLERGEERYRAAPELRRLAWSGRLGRQAGAGFFDYDPE